MEMCGMAVGTNYTCFYIELFQWLRLPCLQSVLFVWVWPSKFGKRLVAFLAYQMAVPPKKTEWDTYLLFEIMLRFQLKFKGDKLCQSWTHSTKKHQTNLSTTHHTSTRKTLTISQWNKLLQKNNMKMGFRIDFPQQTRKPLFASTRPK